jgi:hypothetical protein
MLLAENAIPRDEIFSTPGIKTACQSLNLRTTRIILTNDPGVGISPAFEILGIRRAIQMGYKRCSEFMEGLGAAAN